MRYTPNWLMASVIGFSAALWAFASPLSAAPAADHPDLAKYDWSVKATHNLAAHPPSNSLTSAFLGEVLASDPTFLDPDELESVRFVDLRHSGALSLVVEQGAFRCGGSEVDIVDKTAAGFELYKASEGRPQTDQLIQGINQDGHLELVVDVTYMFHNCASYEAVFPVIYSWTGAGYTDVSDRFREFYRHKLQTLTARLKTIEAKKQALVASKEQGLPLCPDEQEEQDVQEKQDVQISPSGTPAAAGTPAASNLEKEPSVNIIAPVGGRFRLDSPNCVPVAHQLTNDEEQNGSNWRIEAAKIARFLGPSRDAGIAYAIRLSHGDDWRDRMLAAQILADIPTGEARDYLLTLSHDSEAPVAGAARNALNSPPFHPDPLIVKRVSLKELDARAEP